MSPYTVVVVNSIQSLPTPTFLTKQKKGVPTIPEETSRELAKNKRPDRTEKSPQGAKAKAKANLNQALSTSPKEAQAKKMTPGLPTSF